MLDRGIDNCLGEPSFFKVFIEHAFHLWLVLGIRKCFQVILNFMIIRNSAKLKGNILVLICLPVSSVDISWDKREALEPLMTIFTFCSLS